MDGSQRVKAINRGLIMLKVRFFEPYPLDLLIYAARDKTQPVIS
jgi:hypothetical protein